MPAAARWRRASRVITAGGVLEAASAGSRPLGRVHPVVIDAMREKSIDVSGHASKGLDDIDASRFDLMITLCAEEECPWVPIAERRHWPMPNPAGHGLEDVQPIRDAIEQKVLALVEELRGRDA